MQTKGQAVDFYTHVMTSLNRKKIPFMIGGTHAFNLYTGVKRESKDFDIFIAKKNSMLALKQLRSLGFSIELLDPIWIAKVYHDIFFVDIIFAERHGLYSVDDSWLTHAKEATLFGKHVLLMPIEQIIRSKCYVEFRKKYDGADINLLLFRYGKKLDWEWLSKTIEPHWQLLLEHIINFIFVFPDKKDTIPLWIIEEYTKRLSNFFAKPPSKICHTRGQLLSYEYDIAINKWKCKPTIQ